MTIFHFLTLECPDKMPVPNIISTSQNRDCVWSSDLLYTDYHIFTVLFL